MEKIQNDDRVLLHRNLDFWLLGGISLLVWCALKLMTPLKGQISSVDSHFSAVAMTFISLSLVCNYPHFMVSYKLAYGQGPRFIKKNWFQLLLVPVTIIVLFSSFVYGYDFISKPVFQAVNFVLAGLGSTTRFGAKPSDIMSLAANLMFFTVGWHYAKQTFGCMMVTSALSENRVSLWARRILRANFLSLWMINFLTSHFYPADPASKFMDIPFYSLHLPSWLISIAWSIFAVSAIAAVVFLLRGQLKMPKEAWIAGATFWLWYLPVFTQPEFTYHAVPFFHSLQYLAFVGRLERNRNAHLDANRSFLKFFAVAVALVVAGYTAFELAPQWLDKKLNTPQAVGFWFFFLAASLFINIHHYFIDNVLWRFDNVEMKKYLLPSRREDSTLRLDTNSETTDQSAA